MKRFLTRAAMVAGLLAVPLAAWAAVEYQAAAGGALGATVAMWLNGAGLAVPASALAPMPVTAGAAIVTPVASSTSLASSAVLKSSAGAFFGVQVNTTSSAEWVMVFAASALPANGAVTPVLWWQVPPGTTLSVSENPGLSLTSGIVVACSTTGPFTLTASALCTFGGGVVQ